MEKKLAAGILAAGMIFSLSSTTLAAEAVEVEEVAVESPVPEKVHRIKIPTEQREIEQPDYLVNGVIRDVAQKILPVSVEARFYAPRMNLSVRADSIHYNDGSVSLKNDLGFGNDNAPELMFRFKRFNLDYINVDGSGHSSFSAENPLTFGSKDYTGDVHTKSKFNYLKLSMTNPIISVLGNSVNWTYGITGVYWEGKVSGSETSTGTHINESKKYGAPIPTLGLGAQLSPLPSLRIYANASGLPLGGYGHFYDLEAGIRYSPLEIVGIDVGFRRIEAKLSHKDDEGKVTLNGPFAGIRVDF